MMLSRLLAGTMTFGELHENRALRDKMLYKINKRECIWKDEENILGEIPAVVAGVSLDW
jgi:hypothetical protein